MEIEIIPFIGEYKNQVLSISANEIGERFINDHQVSFFLENSKAKAIVAIVDNTISGFLFYQWCTVEEIKNYLLTEPHWISAQFGACDNIGYINLVAVKKESQNKSIGKKLIQQAITELKKVSPVITSVVWKTDNPKHLGIILEKHGLKPILTVKDYWRTDSINKGYSCAVCGKPPCTCTAVIYSNILRY